MQSAHENRGVLQSAVLLAAGFRHGFATRTFDFGAARSREERAASVERLAAIVGFAPERLYQVSQVHGARVVVASGDPAAVAREEADALVASEGQRAVGVRVADCVPVLVGDPASGAALAIHAGWRGAVAGVIADGVARMILEASEIVMDPSRFVAAIGPCIGPCCFEVGQDVAASIEGVSHGRDVVTREAREVGDKAFVDLRVTVRAQLTAIGLDDARIDDIPGCTRCDAARFFSYRRDAESGRHLAVIRHGVERA